MNTKRPPVIDAVKSLLSTTQWLSVRDVWDKNSRQWRQAGIKNILQYLVRVGEVQSNDTAGYTRYRRVPTD